MLLASNALLSADTPAAAPAPDAKNSDSNAGATELRRAAFDYIEKRLAKAPIQNVPWSNKQKMGFDGIDKSKETIRSNSGGLSIDLKWKTITSEQLIAIVRAGAGMDDNFDPEGYVLAAALLAADGALDPAKGLMEKVVAKDAALDKQFEAWLKKLNITLNAPVAPVANGTSAGGSGSSGSSVAASAPPMTAPAKGQSIARRAVPKEHPRLFGTRQRLQALAQERATSFKAMEEIARKGNGDDTNRIASLALVSCITGDAALGKQAVKLVMKYVNGPIRVGHETFGHDLAYCAIVYDLCYDAWTPEERSKFIEYYNKTCDANVKSETAVFHNGYYGYKNWGIGVAAYATYYENPRSPEHLKTLENDVRTRAAPGMELCGDGGGWAEGQYGIYWQHAWMFFCEVARICEGVDYYAMAPKFYGFRAIENIFEMLPGSSPHEFNRPIPMGDGGYGTYGGFSDMTIITRRILCSYYRADPAHQAVQAYNMLTPHNTIPDYAWMDFLFNDPSIPAADLKSFKLSHYSPGPGYIFARSSWDEHSTYLFFKCGDRFTAHQHLDVGHFLLAKQDQLLGDGGVYTNFCDDHVCNYYMRSIAHNTMLVYDPSEKFPDGIRAGPKSTNDGGQHYNFMSANHNAGLFDVEDFNKNRKLFDVADMLAYDDQRAWMYAAGDCTRAYSDKKLDFFTRQIVFIRPATVVIFDRVQAKNPNFKKTFLLQAMKPPSGSGANLEVVNGKSKLFIQTLLPADPAVKLNSGKDLYTYAGESHPPKEKPTGPIPECRIEISPKSANLMDCFLVVLTATDASVQSVPQATVKNGSEVTVTVGNATVKFTTSSVGGSVDVGGARG
ncbi:MAG TPA: heparinase II/III family protein, partial [Planctomycetota bacterium]|nr:heparinase II/III family protein [Planctomycetota bacterium]